MGCWLSSICPPLSKILFLLFSGSRMAGPPTCSLAGDQRVEEERLGSFSCTPFLLWSFISSSSHCPCGTPCPPRQSLSVWSPSCPFSPASVCSSFIKAVALIPVTMVEGDHSALKGDPDVILQRKENGCWMVPKSSTVLGHRLSQEFGCFFPLGVWFRGWPLPRSASGHLGNDSAQPRPHPTPGSLVLSPAWAPVPTVPPGTALAPHPPPPGPLHKTFAPIHDSL